MVQVVVDCPFCHAQKMAMDILGAIEICKPQYISVHQYEHFGTGAAACRKCDNAVSLTLKWRSKNHKEGSEFIAYLSQNNGQTADSVGVNYQVVTPPPEKSMVPGHLPEKVRRAFVQAEKIMRGPDCPDAAAMMYRKAVEIAGNSQEPQPKGNNLSQKIDSLAQEGIIPVIMKEWAHEVRIIGNDSAQESLGLRECSVSNRPFRNISFCFILKLIKLFFRITYNRCK